MVGIAPFGASPPSWGGDGSLNCVVVGDGPGASAAPFEARLSARTSG